MKIHNLVAIAGMLVLPSLGFAADYLVDTQTGDWNVSRTIVVTGSNSNNGSSAVGIGGDVNVANYSGAGNLTKVIIKVLQPTPSVSPVISGTISLGAGESTTFNSNLLSNLIREESSAAASTALNDAITGIGGGMDTYFSQKSASFSGASLSNPNTLVRNLNLTNPLPDSSVGITLFDSSLWGISSSALNSVFRDGDTSFLFSYFLESKLLWDQTTTATLSAALNGVDSGRIVIEYYVPEPGTAVLVGLGGMMLLMRRRRSA